MLAIIEHVLDKYVRPQLSEHYGDIRVLNFKDGVLEIKLTGQCSGCPSAKFTVEDIVEKEIKKHVPNVETVTLIEGISDDMLVFAKKILNHENKQSKGVL